MRKHCRVLWRACCTLWPLWSYAWEVYADIIRGTVSNRLWAAAKPTVSFNCHSRNLVATLKIKITGHFETTSMIWCFYCDLFTLLDRICFMKASTFDQKFYFRTVSKVDSSVHAYYSQLVPRVWMWELICPRSTGDTDKLQLLVDLSLDQQTTMKEYHPVMTDSGTKVQFKDVAGGDCLFKHLTCLQVKFNHFYDCVFLCTGSRERNPGTNTGGCKRFRKDDQQTEFTSEKGNLT